MSPNISGVVRAKATIESITQGDVFNIAIPIANTEQSYALPNFTKAFYLKIRENNANLKVSFTLGDSGITYFTVPRGTNFFIQNLDFSGTIFFQATAICTLELVVWS
jgi:hypothetical protein